MTQFFALDANGDPQPVDPVAYGQGLLDPRRVIASDVLPIPNGKIWVQTEFVGADYDASGRLWQTAVDWSSMLGQSLSVARWESLAEARDGHSFLLQAMQTAADLLNNPPVR